MQGDSEGVTGGECGKSTDKDDMMCKDRSYCCRQIAIFRIFLGKYKNSPDDRT